MDETDLRLCQILIVNSRLPHRELAERLGLSVQAVHRRIQSLVGEGVIRAFTARISASHLNAVQAYLFGMPEKTSFRQVIERLEENDCTETAIAVSGNNLFLVALLQNVSELECYVEFVKKAVSMPAPGVALEGSTQFPNAPDRPAGAPRAPLSELDLRILRSLHRDSRKAVEDISGELGVSAKTVKRHLDRMVADGAVEFGIDFMPASSSGVLSFVAVNLRPGSDRATVRRELSAEHGPALITITTPSNLPDALMIMAWSATIQKQQQLVDRIGAHPGVAAVRSHLPQEAHVFETWRDRMLVEGGKGRRSAASPGMAIFSTGKR
jgi:DNA-binding Lrp family transcriptional regulator